MQIKLEPDVNISHGHVENNMINTYSTDNDDKIDSAETVGMKIVPLGVQHEGLLKIRTNTEQILPSYNQTGSEVSDEYNTEYSQFDSSYNTYSLNSITGDMLPLGESLDLLKPKDVRKYTKNQKIQCPKCPKMCTKYTLNHHLKVHDTIERRSMGVIKGLKTKARNAKNKPHYIREVGCRGEFSCMHCGKEYRMKKSLLRHQKFCTKKVETDIPTKKEKEEYLCPCGKVFYRRSRMETCLRSHSLDCQPVIVKCVACNKIVKDKAELAVHKRKEHMRKRYPCKFCPTDYHTPKELFKHLRKHQKVQLMEYKVISEVVKGKQQLKCFICEKTCTELSELKTHVLGDHKEPYKCLHCDEKFTNIVDFASHTKTLHAEVEQQSVLDVLEAFSKLARSWKCEKCELQFDQPEKLALHQVEQHMKVKTNSELISQFQCTDCSRVFMNMKRLSTHRRMIHSGPDANNSNINVVMDPSVMCVHCRKICKDETSLTSHMRLHSPERKYVCRYCDFRFATLEKRKEHATIHTGDLKFVCFICEYRCSSENRLNAHKKSSKHLTIKESLLTGVPLVNNNAEQAASCSKVKKKRPSKSESSDSESNEPATCNICGEIYPSESKMLEHKQTHPFIEFPNGDQPTRIFFK